MRKISGSEIKVNILNKKNVSLILLIFFILLIFLTIYLSVAYLKFKATQYEKGYEIFKGQSVSSFVNNIPKEVQEEIDRKNEEKKTLEQRAEELENKLQNEKSREYEISEDMSRTLSEVLELQSKILETNLQINILNMEIQNMEIAMNTQKDRIKVAEDRVKEKEEIIKKRINIVYTNGRYKNWDIILSSSSILEAFSSFEMVKRVNELDKEALVTFKKDRNELKKVSDRIRFQEQEIYRKGLEVQKIQKINSNYIIIKNSKMRALNKEQKEVFNNISKLESNKIALEEEMARHAQSYPQIENYIGGVMDWPVIGQRRISVGYLGYPGHKAIDITGGGRIGAPIVSANDGRVVYTKELTYSYGKHMLIDHGGGIYTLYAHLSKIGVNAGDYVRRGEEIGKLGSTGNSTGPHLHFEVRIGGPYYSNRVNPLPYVTNKKSPKTREETQKKEPQTVKPIEKPQKVEGNIVL